MTQAQVEQLSTGLAEVAAALKEIGRQMEWHNNREDSRWENE